MKRFALFKKSNSKKDRHSKVAVFVLGTVSIIAIGVVSVELVKTYWPGIAIETTPIPGPPYPEDTQQQKNKKSTPNPISLSIPKFEINGPVIPVGIYEHSGELEVPEEAETIGWFKYRSKPGDLGPVVLVGHKDSEQGQAVFWHLKDITPGDEIIINREDGSKATYITESIEKFSQNNFPTDMVYGPIDYAGIRIITCAGVYDKQKSRYTENLIVFGRLKS